MQPIKIEDFPQRVETRDKEVQGWFLTYPRCPLSPQDLLNILSNKVDTPAIKEYVIARELHKDGTPHLHAFIKYVRKVGFKRDRFQADEYCGNYQAAKSWWKVSSYCRKKEDFISNIDVDQAASKKASRNQQLISVPTLKLVEDGVLSFLQIKSHIENLQLWNRLQEKLPDRCEDFIPNTFGLALPIQKGKRRHYWFWSTKPDTGKTTFLKTLSTQYPCFHYNTAERFQDPHVSAQLVLLDEYSTAKLFLTDLNQMCDGTYQYPRKNATAVTLVDPIVIICGNRPPEEVYTCEKSWPLINARFTVYCLDS